MAVGAAPLTWNPIAAQVAEAWASGCSFNHNPNAKSEYDAMGGSGGLGENIAAGAPTQTIAGAVGSWTAEEMYYDHATNTCSAPANASCGHYTQIVWSTTTTVGCAQVHCTTNSPFTKFTEWDYSVCDFSPPGNINNQPPY
jgi:pathogenesis-related protein 1